MSSLSTHDRANEGEIPATCTPARRCRRMGIACRLLIAGAFVGLAACASPQQAASPVQLPGESTKHANGLQVPPDAWAHPPSQTASVIKPL